MFAFRDERSAVQVAFTDRLGGLSTGPYAELNLLAQEGDDQATVDGNWDLVVKSLVGGGTSHDRPTRVFMPRQVHGAEVVVVDGELPLERPEADAAVTATPGVVLAARAADCVPVLLADPDRNVVGAAHAGRRGVVAAVVPNAVAALRRLGGARVVAWIGPAACGRCYEVPAGMREEVAGVVPETWSETSWGTPALDLVAGIRAQLRDQGVEDVTDVGRCTIEDLDLYSYRRQGRASGRQAGLVRVRP